MYICIYTYVRIYRICVYVKKCVYIHVYMKALVGFPGFTVLVVHDLEMQGVALEVICHLKRESRDLASPRTTSYKIKP